MTQPITLYSHITGPNPWKVSIILEELKIPYTTKFLEPYETLNPNGRVPAITDPNTSLTLWESGAIIEYLIDTYDQTTQLSYTSSPERYHTKQWLHFQMSGQGPYFGQAHWFTKMHSEKVDSVIDRFLAQIKRVLYVLDRHLKGKEWLVGDKCTYADLSFVMWNEGIPWIFGDRAGELEMEKDYPNFFAWHTRLMERPSVKKVFEDKAAAKSGELPL
ncbi:Bcgst21 [Botrytis cinerea B05.10]|uniref:glutathione transferase n=1 Tax=Botryotinia fuckeliana (strain B05.10) TaxID=332648 RepID=A0A384JN24_BOTFB|nr:Bcgst21 [Botrytis cinerea B05.10]ATZ51764.1 Bcgst21 [Botrytis cinerea B05.10]